MGSESSKHYVRSVQTFLCYSFVYITCFDSKLRSFRSKNHLKKFSARERAQIRATQRQRKRGESFFVLILRSNGEGIPLWREEVFCSINTSSIKLRNHIHHMWYSSVLSMEQTNQQRIQWDQIIDSLSKKSTQQIERISSNCENI